MFLPRHGHTQFFQQLLQVGHLKSPQIARPQIAEHVGNFRIQFSGTDFNDRLGQKVAQFGVAYPLALSFDTASLTDSCEINRM